jgi:putative transcriptional regulator
MYIILYIIFMSKIILKNRIRIARAEYNLTQEELAGLTEVTRQTINSIENGKYCPSTLLAFKISKALGKHIDDIFYLSESR